MPKTSNWIGQNSIIGTFLDSIPCGVMIVERDRRIRTINNVLEQVFGLSSEAVIGKTPGKALGCIRAPSDCDAPDSCRACVFRKVIDSAFRVNKRSEKRAPMQLSINGIVHDFMLLVSATPFEHQGERLCIVVLENVARLGACRLQKEEDGFHGMAGRHPKMLELFELLREVALTDFPVVIEGETGTGKEMVATAIHHESSRALKHFVAVNCSALPHGLLETELFGHVKGAFTGAIRDKMGRFELANGGTIFLDEIGELDPAMQVKLLRVLQEGSFERVGSTQTIKVDVRVISATNRRLEEDVASGRFRADLYYRLCVVPITVPPLRQRRSDIPLLAEHFIRCAMRKAAQEHVLLSPDTLVILMNHHWPGNVRELQNVIHFSVIKCRGRVILPKHLPPALMRSSLEETTKRHRKGKLTMELVLQALESMKGNKVKAAHILGVSRSTLYRFMESQMKEEA